MVSVTAAVGIYNGGRETIYAYYSCDSITKEKREGAWNWVRGKQPRKDRKRRVPWGRDIEIASEGWASFGQEKSGSQEEEPLWRCQGWKERDVFGTEKSPCSWSVCIPLTEALPCLQHLLWTLFLPMSKNSLPVSWYSRSPMLEVRKGRVAVLFFLLELLRVPQFNQVPWLKILTYLKGKLGGQWSNEYLLQKHVSFCLPCFPALISRLQVGKSTSDLGGEMREKETYIQLRVHWNYTSGLFRERWGEIQDCTL